MININSRRDFGYAGVQLTIRDQLNLDPTDLVKIAMEEALKRCGLSREAVVEEINKLAKLAGVRPPGRADKLSVDMLNKWVARGARNYVIPIGYIRIFNIATGTDLVAEAVCRPHSHVIDQEESACLRWAKGEMELRRRRKEVRRLAQEVGIE